MLNIYFQNIKYKNIKIKYKNKNIYGQIKKYMYIISKSSIGQDDYKNKNLLLISYLFMIIKYLD